MALAPVRDHAKEAINHFVLVLDESTSMTRHRSALIKVADSLVASWAVKSKEFGQQTRVTVYAFNNYNNIRCLVYDTDVLRLPSISQMYQPGGITALVDATIHAIDDLSTTPEKYGEHAYVLFVLTDGIENDSRVSSNPAESLRRKIADLPDHWSLCGFVPDNSGVSYLKNVGFPAGNISKWDASSAQGMEDVGKRIETATTSFYQARKSGIRSSTSLFQLKAISTDDIRRNLSPLQYYQYSVFDVPADSRIDEFVIDRTGKYDLGSSYYQLTKTETIQPQKQLAVMLKSGGAVYTGANARKLLGLPDEHVKVKPTDHPSYDIFVQSTSLNRKLIRGTKLLLLR